MTEPIWVRDDVVLAIHRRQIAEHGGVSGLRDEGLLASAPEATPDLAGFAASYAYGIIRNHPFLDGNKRTAFVVCRTFLLLNGLDLAASKKEKYETFLRLSQGEISESKLGAWIRDRVRSPGG
ncbi:MAG: type II toxin-antitoxin system death-on-curing family toxin [Thermoanaerobaculia bacterium]|nr:type II toxin-antitoxin system death-on-curing family toxin [Thermoanaerobaculia bacterium]